LLLLVAIVFGYFGLEELTRGIVLGRDENPGFFLFAPCVSLAGGKREGTATGQNLPGTRGLASTYIYVDALAEARPPIEPVVVSELIDLDALAIVGRRRGLGHSTGGSLLPLARGDTPGASTRIADSGGGRRGVLLGAARCDGRVAGWERW